jgi:hypothetical protein
LLFFFPFLPVLDLTVCLFSLFIEERNVIHHLKENNMKSVKTSRDSGFIGFQVRA